MLKRDREYLKSILGGEGKFIEVSFRIYEKEGLVFEIVRDQKYFKFDTTIINGYYPIGVINVNSVESAFVKIIKEVFPNVENIFAYSDSLTNVSLEKGLERKWTKLGTVMNEYNIFDYDCAYIAQIPNKYNFNKIDNIRFAIPDNITIKNHITNQTINDYLIFVND